MTKKLLAMTASLLLLPLCSSWGCNVPVFRYALERWPASPYRALIVKDSELTATERAAEVLLENAGDSTTGALNLAVWNPNKDELEKSGMAKQLPQPVDKGAMLYLFFPVAAGIEKPFWTAKLNQESVRKIRNSPFRHKLIQKILEGNSGVFILLESENKSGDNKVYKELNQNLTELQKNMKLPEGVVGADGDVTGNGPAGDDPINQLQSPIPLKLAFTTLCLQRQEDEVLVALLMSLRPEREEPAHKVPMVFAVYGRGRTLVPMVGEEIMLDNITSIAYFFTGACSCQMKALNPGTDLLLEHDWDRSIFGGD